MVRLTDPSHILYGTDTGAATEDTVARNTAGLLAYGFSPEELADIDYRNATGLFPRLEAVARRGGWSCSGR